MNEFIKLDKTQKAIDSSSRKQSQFGRWV